MWILNWKKIELKNKPVAWIEGIEYSWRKRLGFVRRARERVWGHWKRLYGCSSPWRKRLGFVRREREFWVSVFDLLISLSFSVLSMASFFLGSIVSPFNCILTQSSPYTACTASTSASTSSSSTMRERFFFSFLFWEREKNKDAFSSFYSNVVF